MIFHGWCDEGSIADAYGRILQHPEHSSTGVTIDGGSARTVMSRMQLGVKRTDRRSAPHGRRGGGTDLSPPWRHSPTSPAPFPFAELDRPIRCAGRGADTPIGVGFGLAKGGFATALSRSSESSNGPIRCSSPASTSAIPSLPKERRSATAWSRTCPVPERAALQRMPRKSPCRT